MSLIALFLMLAADPASKSERVLTAYCQSIRTEGQSNQPGSTRVYAGTGLCFSGEIDGPAALAFTSSLDGLTASPIIVINSGGGDVDAGLDMAESIRTRHATVIVDGVCASSCANYIFPAGGRRVISRNGILAFHGGAVAISDDDLRQMLKPIVPLDQLDQAVASAREDNANRLARQDAFEAEVGMRGFFRWMAELNALPPEEKSRLCPDETATALVFSPRRLQEQGLVVQVNDGPQSGGEVSQALRENDATWTACYIH